MKNYYFRKAFSGTAFYLFAILCALVMAAPFFFTLSTSLKASNEIFQLPPSLIPHHLRWVNFLDASGLLPFPRLFMNSAIVAVSVTILTIALCSTAAFAFSRLSFRGSHALFVLYLSTLMIPFAVTLIPSFIIVRTLGWLNTYWGLIIPVACGGVGFGTFLLRQFFISIPMELDEAAWMDGASAWPVFFRITIPLSTPPLMTLGIYTFISNWNNLLWALVIVDNEKMKTLTLGLATMTSAVLYTPPWNQVMAATLIGILPVIVIYIFAQRYFIQAMTLTGIKG